MKVNYWVGLLLAVVLSAGAQGVPDSFNYQGVLRGGSGEYLAAGSYNVGFRLYPVATGGSAKWGRQYAVLLDTNGLFNVELDDGAGSELIANSTLTATISSNETLYLGLTVEGSTEIAPRQQLLSVPYALRAGDVKEAAGDFEVAGVLRANDGAIVEGTVQASTSLQVGTAGTGVATLTAYGTGGLQVPDLYVSGNATLAHNLDVAGNTTLTHLTATGDASLGHNLDVAGSATLANLTVNGTSRLAGVVSAFSTNVPNAADFAELSKTSTTQLLAEASSDGFITINLFYSLDTNKSGDMNEAYSDIKFTGRGQDRSIRHGIRINNMDATHFSKIDTVTLPVLKGEKVEWSPDGWDVESSTKVSIRSFFVPFGVNQ